MGEAARQRAVFLEAEVVRLHEDVDRLRNALVVARDFIEHHPAVSGTWPLVTGMIRDALAAAPATDQPNN